MLCPRPHEPRCDGWCRDPLGDAGVWISQGSAAGHRCGSSHCGGGCALWRPLKPPTSPCRLHFAARRAPLMLKSPGIDHAWQAQVVGSSPSRAPACIGMRLATRLCRGKAPGDPPNMSRKLTFKAGSLSRQATEEMYRHHRHTYRSYNGSFTSLDLLPGVPTQLWHPRCGLATCASQTPPTHARVYGEGAHATHTPAPFRVRRVQLRVTHLSVWE